MTESGFRAAFEEILDVPRGSLRNTDTRDSIDNWSSIADVQLFTLITTEFGIEPDEEILGAESIGELTDVLSKRHVFEG